MARRREKSAATPLHSIRHKDTRKNIPTEELRDFVTEEEEAPKTMLYPRDPSLDPQLVWKGKDEQDAADLPVPVVPIYIQEKIHPQAIIDSLPRKTKDWDQPNLFADFNGLPEDFDQRVDFYQHEGHWSNRLILGDSLLVMTSLAEKEGLKGKVQMIYIDPPYGIKFGSNWQVSTRKRDVKDGRVEDVTRQPEQVRAFRDTWKLGVHSYLAYLRDRLVVARDLLTESGSVFVQIGDENVHLVRCLLDEVFGSENFCAMITFVKTSGLGATLLPRQTDYILWYARESSSVKYRQLYRLKALGLEGADAYSHVLLPDGSTRRITEEERKRPSLLPYGSRVFRYGDLTKPGPGRKYKVMFEGREYDSGSRWWGIPENSMRRAILAGRVAPQGNSLAYIRFLDDFPAFPITNVWDDTATGSGMDKVYVVQTDTKIIQRCLLMTTDPGDLVLDPTCGSGTTAYVAEEWGRRWITCDTSRVALALARTRLMAARYPYYLLADSPEGIRKESEVTGTVLGNRAATGDIKKGFVYKRVPHITLKCIVNNPELRDGMTKEQIGEAIARHADTELLYDQPYEDRGTVRVSGPFTVESLSPHRVLSTGDAKGTQVGADRMRQGQDFAAMILENLRRAGVQNTRKSERLKFDEIEPYPGTWVHAAGRYTDADGKIKRVAVSLGPEQGTVSPQQVKEAAKEAVQGVGFDLLLVCGFAFDPHVSEESKRYGRLVVLPTRMNPDLAMGDELLKKTGAGNLFMVFGEPDIEVAKNEDGRITVEVRGVDVYDPTTGEVRSSSADDIACWFIDTDYDGESFFVRHAYFTGADEPYEKLKRALKADIDEQAWATLYRTVSRPFELPRTGKIAVKVINHYGDEVLKVFAVG